MSRRCSLLVAVLVALASCRGAPSPSYREASDLYDRIRAEETAQGLLVPDFRDERWEKVMGLLASVPEKSADYLAARLLLAQIKPARDQVRQAKSSQCQWNCQTRIQICGGGCGCVVTSQLMGGGLTAECFTSNPALQGQPIRNHPCINRCEQEYNACTAACPGFFK
jgi:hypothetical protein